MSGRKPRYKDYFRSVLETPSSIPRRTRFRHLKPRRLAYSATTTEDIVTPPNLPSFSAAAQSSQSLPCFTDDNEVQSNAQSNVNIPESIFSSDDDEEESLATENPKSGLSDLLFPGARITEKESTLLIYSFLLRHKLSKSATTDLLSLINFHLPNSTSIPTTTYLLEKDIEADYTRATKVFYCPECECSVDQDTNCINCKESYTQQTLLKGGNFYVSFDLKASLQGLLNMPVIQDDLTRNIRRRVEPSSAIKDITDGNCYHNLNLKDFDFTCTINTDGVNIFNSSKFSIWPLLISINELSYRLRRTHTLLVGIWFGKKKPNFFTFLSKFVDQCNDLSNNGLAWTNKGVRITSKIYFPLVAADSVARCTLQGIKQFNGEYGCPSCHAKGEFLSENGISRKWIYRPGDYDSRTNELFISHLRTLKQNLLSRENNCTYGVIAASPLLKLQKFNIIDGFVFDYMHTCLLGIVRMITQRWMDPKNHDCDYYIGTKEEVISEAFCRFKLPSECNRMPRPLSEISYWKASEWKTWMLVCIPLLHNIQKPTYLKHFSKFVTAITILNSTSISSNELIICRQLLKEFCFNAPNLYGLNICTFNMHLLLHVVRCVENWGPLWSYSMFQYEHVNGVLNSYFAGTNQICMQIVRKVIVTQHIFTLGQLNFKHDFPRQYFVSMIENKRYQFNVLQIPEVTLLGIGKPYIFNEREIRQLSQMNLEGTQTGLSFKCCILEGRKYSVSSKDSAKRTDSIIEVNDKLYSLLKIIIVEKNENKFAIILVHKIITVPIEGLNHVRKIVCKSDSVKILHLTEIKKCKYILGYNTNGTMSYIVKFPNTIELE